jgi:hypothetical protein
MSIIYNKTATSEFLEFFHNKKSELMKNYDGKYYFPAKILTERYYNRTGSKVIYIPTIIDSYNIGLI